MEIECEGSQVFLAGNGEKLHHEQDVAEEKREKVIHVKKDINIHFPSQEIDEPV